MIPQVPLVTIQPRLPNARLFELCGKEAGGKLTALEKIELDCLCKLLEAETGQDISND
jgi:hypothetical protein